jgi:fatty acid desaturase
MMGRFEIVIFGKRPGETGPDVRRVTLGRIGTIVAATLLTLLAAVALVAALVLGYVVAGLIVAALLVALLVALVRGAFQSLRG